MTAAAPSDPEAQFDSRQPRTLTAPSYQAQDLIEAMADDEKPTDITESAPAPEAPRRRRKFVEAPRETAERRRRETAGT